MSSPADSAFPRERRADELAFRLQRGFRALLEAMSRPGELVSLDAPEPETAREAQRLGLYAQTLAICDVLLDGQTTLCVAGNRAAETGNGLSCRTHVQLADASEARFAIIAETATCQEAAALMSALCPGTLASPHLGATCLVECKTLYGADRDSSRSGSARGTAPARAWELSGPGIASAARIACDRAAVLEARLARDDEFPCGIDLVLIDSAGHLACIPRSARLEALGGCEEVLAWAM